MDATSEMKPEQKSKSLKDMYDGFLREIKTEDGNVPFLKDIWNFFGSKGTKTIFYSVNPEKTFWVDLEVCESLGCPIHILANSDEVVKRWDILSKTLKARKIEEADEGYEWLKGVEKKWILTKNLKVTKQDFEWKTLKSVASENKHDRIDLLKIEASSEEERILLYSCLDTGFRPGIVLMKYTFDPDNSVPSMLVAGHLQMTGYRLISCENNWFLYLYQDFCIYDSCSWRNTTVQNPAVASLFEAFQESEKKEGTTQQQPEKNPSS